MTTQVRDVNPETRRASRLLPLSSLPMELLAAPFNIGQEMATYAVHPHALILAQHEAVRKTLVSGTMANNNCCSRRTRWEAAWFSTRESNTGGSRLYEAAYSPPNRYVVYDPLTFLRRFQESSRVQSALLHISTSAARSAASLLLTTSSVSSEEALSTAPYRHI